jgi:DNA mismatch repair ATPase MutS
MFYSKFVENIKERKDSILSLYTRLSNIIESKKLLMNISQIGIIMNLYYEIFMDDIHHQNMIYLFQLSDYISDMRELSKLVKEKKIRKCKFGNTTTIKDGYYLPYINDNYKSNTICLNKNILITGPNAAGKTTTIKSLLINTILSQQIGYGCYKSAIISPYDYFHSYLNIPDTSGRDSLFQAEARRCKDILECITNNPEKNHLCIFDEIYSGTNPNDAVMCAKLYLKYMNKQSNVNYIITTHYIQMCEFFDTDSNVINMKMDVIENEDKIDYLYKLVDGISYVHGGKYVLKQLDYPKYLFD